MQNYFVTQRAICSKYLSGIFLFPFELQNELLRRFKFADLSENHI